ncbi:MAG: TRAP transporter small permease [Burkholderiales bacterium]|nr:TRAP transporter small permease [Burkholderiales bacterium]
MARPLRWLAWAAGALVVLMMAVTVVDVVGRYFLDRPLKGSAEATEFLLACLVFAGIPIAAATGEHIRIDLLDHMLPRTLLRWQRVFGSLVAALVIGFVAWRLLLRGNELARLGDRSSHLDLPNAPFAWFMAAMAALAVIVFLSVAWRALRYRD